jgi:hypothetical protein
MPPTTHYPTIPLTTHYPTMLPTTHYPTMPPTTHYPAVLPPSRWQAAQDPYADPLQVASAEGLLGAISGSCSLPGQLPRSCAVCPSAGGLSTEVWGLRELGRQGMWRHCRVGVGAVEALPPASAMLQCHRTIVEASSGSTGASTATSTTRVRQSTNTTCVRGLRLPVLGLGWCCGGPELRDKSVGREPAAPQGAVHVLLHQPGPRRRALLSVPQPPPTRK